MTKTSKIALSALAASAMALTSVQASPITGGVTIGGSYTAANNNLTTANDVITVSQTGLSASAANGSFTIIGATPTLTFLTPITLNGSPDAVGKVLWTINSGQFTFTVLTEGTDGTPTTTSNTLMGTGRIDSNVAGLDSVTGSYTLNFSVTGGTQFGFTDVSAANVPDGGTTAILLGAALTSLGFIRRKLSA